MTDSSSCARFNPARPLLELHMGSLSIWRSAAATRSRARSKSATVYCRGSGRVAEPADDNAKFPWEAYGLRAWRSLGPHSLPPRRLS